MQPTHILPDLVDGMTESHLRRNPLCFDTTIVSSLCAYLGGTRRRATRMFGLAGHFYDDIRAHGPRPSRRHNRIGAYLRVFVRIPHLNSQTRDRSHDLIELRRAFITCLSASPSCTSKHVKRPMAQHYATGYVWSLRTALRRLELLPSHGNIVACRQRNLYVERKA